MLTDTKVSEAFEVAQEYRSLIAAFAFVAPFALSSGDSAPSGRAFDHAVNPEA